jgi:CDP-diacylglycerol--glycerol-3-phosphate 3-phosphatidyltransferase
MNLPNKLTLGRILLVPLFVAALLIPFPLHNLTALVLFAAASITDMFDGRIAREQGLVTDFGKFADPLADKILVLAALLCFVQNGLCDCVAVIIVLIREFSVTSIRLIAAAKGEVVAANIWGKIKTVTQMTAIISILVMQSAFDIMELAGISFYQAPFKALPELFFWLGELLIWISTIFAVISGVIYIKQNWKFIKDI